MHKANHGSTFCNVRHLETIQMSTRRAAWTRCESMKLFSADEGEFSRSALECSQDGIFIENASGENCIQSATIYPRNGGTHVHMYA